MKTSPLDKYWDGFEKLNFRETGAAGAKPAQTRTPVDPSSVELHQRTLALLKESGYTLDYGEGLRRARSEQGSVRRETPVDQNSVALHETALVCMSEESSLDYGQALCKARRIQAFFAELASK